MQITLTYSAADDIITLSVFYLKQSELGRISFLKKNYLEHRVNSRPFALLLFITWNRRILFISVFLMLTPEKYHIK